MYDDRLVNNGKNNRRTKFLLLLLVLLGLVVVEPFFNENSRITFLLNIFFSAIIFSSIYAVSEKRSTFWVAVLLAVPKFVTIWALGFITHPLLSFLDTVFGFIFIGYIIILILFYIFKQDEVTLETIYGAIVVYILIGLFWVFLYLVVEFIHPQSFSIPPTQKDNLHKILQYYSFVTLTTLGYGDITPVSGPAKSLTVLEAIVGQMYIAVLIARLVGVHISQGFMKK